MSTRLWAERIHEIGTENAFKIGPHISKVEQSGKNVVKFNLGEPDFNIPPPVADEVKRQLDLGNTHYTDPKGILKFRKAIAKYISETRQIKVDPEQVVVFPGAKPAIGFCHLAYVNPGDEVVYPTPGFPIYESFVRFVGAIPKPVVLQESKGFTFSAEALATVVTRKTKLIILNFPSNPTGGVASREQLEEIADVINKQAHPDVRIYSDEVYDRILFDGLKHVSIASIKEMYKKTIIVSGHSKTYAWTGGRIGYAVFPTVEEAETFKNLNINFFSCVPPFLQEAATVALENPEVEKYVKQMVDAFQKRRDYLIPALNSIPGVRCAMPKGAFYAFPNVEQVVQKLGFVDYYNSLSESEKARTSPTTMLQMFLLYEYGVATVDRRSFGVLASEGQHFIRISFATDLESLKVGIERMKQAFQDRDRAQKFLQTHKDTYLQ